MQVAPLFRVSSLSRFAFFPRPIEQTAERKQSSFNERRRGWGGGDKCGNLRFFEVFRFRPRVRGTSEYNLKNIEDSMFHPRVRRTSLYSFLVSVSVFIPSA